MLSAGFFAIILITGLFVSTEYLFDITSNNSQTEISSTAEPIKIATESALTVLAPQEPPAPSSRPSMDPTPPPLPSIPPSPSPRPTLSPVVSPSPAPTPVVVQPIPTSSPAPLAEQDTAAQSSTSEYVVKAGDTLWNIAEQIYSDGQLYSRISRDNNLSNPDKILVGQKLVIGSQDSIKGEGGTLKGSITDKAWSDDKTVYVNYTIVKGDSLWKIADRELGDPYLWTELYQINKVAIGSNPDLIYPNTVLRIPTESKPVSSTPHSFNWTSSLLQ